jgi:hypothetical protein
MFVSTRNLAVSRTQSKVYIIFSWSAAGSRPPHRQPLLHVASGTLRNSQLGLVGRSI